MPLMVSNGKVKCMPKISVLSEKLPGKNADPRAHSLLSASIPGRLCSDVEIRSLFYRTAIDMKTGVRYTICLRRSDEADRRSNFKLFSRLIATRHRRQYVFNPFSYFMPLLCTKKIRLSTKK